MNNQNIPVSVLILTLNEEDNLPGCLSALSWCDDIVVIDSGSTDRTCEIAEKFGARIFTRVFDDFANQRNFGLTDAVLKHEWILHLDADEVVTPDLISEMATAIRSPYFDAYRIPSKTIFMNRWLRYSGMYPVYQVRLTRKGVFRFKQVGHGQREDIPTERIGSLSEPYLHHTFSKGIHDWVERHNRYSTAEAEEILRHLRQGKVKWANLFGADVVERRRTLKEISYRLPFRPLFRFFYMFVLRKGFLDGKVGLTYCRLLMLYESMTGLKVYELKQSEKISKIKLA